METKIAVLEINKVVLEINNVKVNSITTIEVTHVLTTQVPLVVAHAAGVVASAEVLVVAVAPLVVAHEGAVVASVDIDKSLDSNSIEN